MKIIARPPTGTPLPSGTHAAVPARLTADAGLNFPVVLTAAAWNDCVRWPADTPGGDEDGRLYDLVWMTSRALRTAQRQGVTPVTVHRVPLGNTELGPQEVTLTAEIRTSDDDTPLIVIDQPAHPTPDRNEEAMSDDNTRTTATMSPQTRVTSLRLVAELTVHILDDTGLDEDAAVAIAGTIDGTRTRIGWDPTRPEAWAEVTDTTLLALKGQELYGLTLAQARVLLRQAVEQIDPAYLVDDQQELIEIVRRHLPTDDYWGDQ
ncbi:hypothetical protein [Actinomadura miaoliensis]|uniref:Uncharacterized protein n=1 Tax=Actinomadura miaoliensis TaxID=430685 RepID=A0ABP7X1G1_9ACTN